MGLQIPKASSNRICAVTLLSAAAFLLGAGIRDTWESRYEAVAVVRFGEGSPQSWGKELPAFVTAEMKAISSAETLQRTLELLSPPTPPTSERSSTASDPSRPPTVAQLKESLRLQPVVNPARIEIRVRDAQPERATRLANAIANAHNLRRQFPLVVEPAAIPTHSSFPNRLRGLQLMALGSVLLIGGWLAYRSATTAGVSQRSSGNQ